MYGKSNVEKNNQFLDGIIWLLDRLMGGFSFLYAGSWSFGLIGVTLIDLALASYDS